MSRKLAKSTAVFSAMTLISRILGYVRDMIIAHIFGANAATDAFFVAFKVPNFMRRLFAEGAFSQAFVPLLGEYKEKRSAEEMRLFVDHVSGTLATILFLFTIVSVAAAPLIIMLFAPGFGHHDEQFQLAAQMLRITFPYVLFISLTAFAGGVLNTHNHFAGPALTPAWLNVVMIIAALWGAPFFHVPIIGLAWGVFFAGIVQWLFQFPFLKRYAFVPRFKWGWKDPGVQRILKLMVPALFGVSVSQIGLLLTTIFASYLPHGSITWLYNSERLLEFPLGGFGVAISTVILPHLSRKHAAESHEEYSETLAWAMRSVLLIGLPCMVGLFMLSQPLMTTLFNYGKYNEFDVLMSSRSLMAYSLGVPFMMLVKVLASGFYAKQNIKTPVKVAVFVLIITMIFNFIFIGSLKHVGLAFAASLGALVNSVLLLFWLIRQKIFFHHQGWFSYFLRIGFANGAMIIFLYLCNPTSAHWFEWHVMERVGVLAALLLGANIIYFASLKLMRFNLKDFKG
jgi:putative peptidoglycan lipid II flippase